MAIPCYAYMKLKMRGLNGVITVSGDPKNAYEAEVANLQLAEVELASAGLEDTKTTVEPDSTSLAKKPKTGSVPLLGQDDKNKQMNSE